MELNSFFQSFEQKNSFDTKIAVLTWEFYDTFNSVCYIILRDKYLSDLPEKLQPEICIDFPLNLILVRFLRYKKEKAKKSFYFLERRLKKRKNRENSNLLISFLREEFIFWIDVLLLREKLVFLFLL